MSSEVTTHTAERQLGRVKWFNNKAGYGFITVTDGKTEGNDIFVHHSSIQVSSEQYKYLVQGEYVEFLLERSNGGSHEWQAGQVSGIRGGKLMCETRHDFRTMRNEKIVEEEVKNEVQQEIKKQEWKVVDDKEKKTRGRPRKYESK
jgi:CspA family cold shock protein